MANMIRMGSLYLDDQPILPLVEFQQDQAIGIGKAVPGKEITWVLVNGILIADQCLLSNISWDDLNTQGLIFGKEVSIGGLRYTLRSLRVGACEGMPNEWDAALDIVGENGGVWTGKGPRFWGQERAAGIPPVPGAEGRRVSSSSGGDRCLVPVHCLWFSAGPGATVHGSLGGRAGGTARGNLGQLGGRTRMAGGGYRL